MTIQPLIRRVKEETEVVSPIQNKKENKLIGRQLLRPGHTLFEVNTKTGEINPATYKEVMAKFNGGTSLKVDVKTGCVYVQALNKKNALKRYKRDF